MSVMMGLRIIGDPARIEQALNSDPERLKRIGQRARDAGCIHHRFFANEAGGEVLVVDEWPDAGGAGWHPVRLIALSIRARARAPIVRSDRHEYEPHQHQGPG